MELSTLKPEKTKKVIFLHKKSFPHILGRLMINRKIKKLSYSGITPD